MDPAAELAGLRARIKSIEGGKLTTREKRALDAWVKATTIETRDALLRALPKGVYCELAGRQQKVVDAFGDRYDVPVDGPVVDLYAVIQTLHTRVGELAAAARPNLDGDESELVKEKLRQEIGKLQRQSAVIQIELEKHAEKIVAKNDIQAGLDWLVGNLRMLGGRLYQDAPDAVEAFNDFLTDLAAELEAGSLRF